MVVFLLWAGFILFIIAMLALDLGVLHRGAKIIPTRSALLWSGVCVILALAFSVAVYFLYDRELIGTVLEDGRRLSGREAAMQFIAGWLIEQSLSLDNVFVIALIFVYFGVPREYQHRTLFWGIMGALIMRGLMIAAGTALIQRFDWIIYLFGALLVYTAIKMLLVKHEDVHPDRNPLVKLARRIYPVASHFEGEKFFTHLNGKRAMTPLFLALLVVESTDVIFAVDSIPAVFAVTMPFNDPFIVFTSNVFAILNLRSLYFALSGLMEKFKQLKYSLVLVLAFVGVKMLLTHHVEIPTGVALGVVATLLAGGVLVSIVVNRRSQAEGS